jgi:VWFA-related protein
MVHLDDVALSMVLSAAVAGGLSLDAAPARLQSPGSDAATTTPILVDVVVTDRSGNPVGGLSAGDFDIREDGAPRAVEGCTSVDLPLDIPAAGGAARVTDAGDRRVYVLAIDTAHLSSRGATRLADVLARFVTGYFGPNDRAVVVTLGTPPRRSNPIGDRQQLLRLIGATSDSASRRADASPPSLGLLGEFGVVPDRGDVTAHVLRSLAAIVHDTSAASGHRLTVFLVSEGLTSTPREAQKAETELLAAAARANASVYPMDPRGMQAVTTGLSPGPEERPIGVEGWNSLREIADGTGGRAILGRDDVDAAFLQVVQDASAYYVLTYTSPHAADRDGHFHKVTVHVRKPGMSVTARRGWYAPKSPIP